MSMFSFLVNVNEAFGYTHEHSLNSSYTLINAMLSENSYKWMERNRELKGEEQSDDFEWIELPDFDNPGKSIRVKKYKDLPSGYTQHK